MSRATGIRERLLSPVGLHAVGFGVLAIATILLGIRVVLDWRATSSSSVDAKAERQLELRTLQVQTAPLRGLDKKVDRSREQIDDFYAKRIPPSYSAILERLGELKAKGPVQLTRGQYTQAPGSGDLTEIRMDAGLSGDYSAVMRFVNGLERSQTFFVIRAMNLTGQQGGMVNLRLQVSTWMRPEDAAASGLPIDGAPSTAPPGPGTGTGTGGAGEPNSNSPGTAAIQRSLAGAGEGL
jgi:type IV pilus assembly protein PilO